MFEGPESRVTSPRAFVVLIGHTGDTDGILVNRNERGGSVEQVGGVSELNIFRAVLLADVKCGADFLHFLLRMERPQTLELSVMEGQTDGNCLGEKVEGREGTVGIVDMIYVPGCA